MSFLERLPDELILNIASMASESSLSALARTNQRLHAICDPCLYRQNVLYGESSAMDWAAKRGMLEIFQKSLDAGAPLLVDAAMAESDNIPSVRSHPLISAAEGGHEDMVQFILDRGVSPDLQISSGYTALSVAVLYGYTSLVRLLLDHGARQDILDRMDCRPLQHASAHYFQRIAEMLIVNLRQRDDDFFRELAKETMLDAVRHNNVAIIHLFIEHGVDVNYIHDNETPLGIAAAEGEIELVRLFLDNGADENLLRDPQYTNAPLSDAVLGEHVEVCEALVRGTTNLHRTRALSFAVREGYEEIVEMLLDKGTPPDFRQADIPGPPGPYYDHEAWAQPLQFAVQLGNWWLTGLLLQHGADANIECVEWPIRGAGVSYNRVIFSAVTAEQEDMVDLLLAYGAETNIADVRGRSLLSHAVVTGNESIIKSLLDHGANPHHAIVISGKNLRSLGRMKESTRLLLQEAESKWAEKL
ncbi:hypothetical protein FE257_009223 [Aspergillus nanangensis]|uniref:F-box domain-containing protein n=1 Tax=Aspergillus nanangensis TaxID=2582783 RepID=A0AAD4CM13_ASPNN|nr:hypothetical protein FE257_009223 [Aspergillus nanangensis]